MDVSIHFGIMGFLSVFIFSNSFKIFSSTTNCFTTLVAKTSVTSIPFIYSTAHTTLLYRKKCESLGIVCCAASNEQSCVQIIWPLLAMTEGDLEIPFVINILGNRALVEHPIHEN